jgi:hypothetical protein
MPVEPDCTALVRENIKDQPQRRELFREIIKTRLENSEDQPENSELLPGIFKDGRAMTASSAAPWGRHSREGGNPVRAMTRSRHAGFQPARE